MTEPHEEVEKTEARAGETPHIGRYILLFSTVILVIAFIVLLIVYGL
ncbi:MULTISPECIES: hypothetical protein [Pacificimonas]|uniref:Cytochrome c oxidase subunit IV bacterial aa3 type domain-containing protein n=1 Tax=Pacificimonas aurantium TaxID=1250540 RepID=A0ABS7WIU7_9SPHN|nr:MULTISPECIES: hypothetical protein [Pacificimonas]MBZ6378315.1 hypothetical protein [Pacificimonas aurantium]